MGYLSVRILRSERSLWVSCFLAKDLLANPADLVAHILYNAFERGGSLVSPIGWPFGDFQVKET